jgi:hypothetical protein
MTVAHNSTEFVDEFTNYPHRETTHEIISILSNDYSIEFILKISGIISEIEVHDGKSIGSEPRMGD